MDNNTPTIAFGDTLPSGVEPRFPYGLFAGSQLVNPAGTSPNETIQTTLPPLDNLGEEERKRDEIANYRLFAAVDNTAFGQTTKAGQFNVQSYIGMQSGTGVDKDAEGTYWNPGNWFNFSTSDRETIGEQELNRQTSAGSGVRGMFKEDNQDYNRSLINTAESSKEMFPFDATTSYEWAGKNLGGTFGSWANSVGELVNWVSTDKTDMDAFNVEAKLGAKANGWNSDVAYEATRNYLRDNPKIASYFNETGVDPHEFTRLTNNPFAWTFQMNRAVIASQSNKRLLDYEETTGFFGDKADKLFYGVKDPTMARDLLVTTLASFGFATLETGLAKLAATGAARSIGATAAVDATSKGVGKYLVRGISGGPLTGPIESLTYNAFKTVLPSVGHNGWATAGARAVAIASDAAVQGGIFAANAQKDAYNFEHLVLNFGEYAPEFKYDTAQIMDAAYEGGKMGLMFFGGMRLALGLRGDYKAVKAAPKGKKFGAFTNNLSNSLDSFSVTPEGRTIFGNTLGGNRGILFGDLMDKGMRGLDNRNTAGVLVNGRQLYHNEGFTAEVVAKGGFNEDKARQIVPLWTKLTNIAKVPDALIDPELLAKSDLTYDSVIELLTTIGETQAQALKQRIAGGPTGLFTIFRPFDNFTGKIATRTEMEANLAPIKAELEAKHTELTELTRGREKTLSERAGLDITDLSENEYKATKEKLVADIEDLKERVAAKEKVTPEEAAKLDANNKRLAVIERELKEAGSAYGRLGLSSEDAAKRTALRGEIRRLEGQDLNTITATTKAGKKSQTASLRAKREELRGYQKAFQDIDDKANNVVDSRTLPEADRAANDLLNIEKRKAAAAEDLTTEANRATFDSTQNPDRFKNLRDEARALRGENKTDISDSKAKSVDRGLTDASDLLASEKQLSDLEKAYTEDVDFKTRSRALNLAVIEARKGLNDKNNLVILAMSENARRLESLEQDLKFSGPGFSEARVKEAIVRLRKEIASREGKFETVAEEKARLKALRKALRNGVKDLPKSEIAALKEAMRDVSGETSKTNIKAKIKDLIELMGGEEGVKEARRARVILDTMNNSLGFGSANTVAVIHHIMNTSGVLAEAEKAGLKLSDMEAKFTELVGRSINYGSPLEVYHAKAIINHMIGGNNADIVLGVLTEVQKITGYQSKNGAILSAARVKQVISEVFKTADKRTKAPTDSKSTVFYISDRNFGQSRSIQLSNSHIIRVEIDVDGNIKVEVQKGSLEFKDGKIGPVYPKFREAADFTKDNVIDMGTFKATWDLYSKAVGTILDQKDTQRVELLSTTLDTLANETKGMLLDAEITSVARIVEARAVMKNSSNTDVLAASKEIRELVSAQMAEAKAASKKGPYKEKHKTLLENLFTLEGLKEILVERASLEADPAIKTALQAEIKRLEDPNLSVGEGIRSYHEKPEVAKTKGKKKAQKEKSKATPDSKEELSTDLAGIDFGEGVPTKVGDAAAEEVTVPVTKPVLFTTSGKPILEPTPDNLKFVFGFDDNQSVIGAIIMKSLGVSINRLGNASVKLMGDFVSEGDSEIARIFLTRTKKGVGALLAANKSGDLFTVSHEMGHYARFLFLDPLASVEERAKIGITDSMYDNMMNWLNAKKNAEGKYILTEAQEEKFANGFGIYIQKLLNGDGKASNTGIQFAFNKIGEHLGGLYDGFGSLGKTEATKDLVVSAEAEAVYSALMNKGAEANITDIFHLGFKDVLSSMSVDEQHLFGQRILGKMKWEAYKAQMQKDTAVPATVTSKVVDAVVEGKAVPIVPARVAVTNADVATAKLAIAKTPKEKVAATAEKVVSDAAVTKIEVKATIDSVVVPSLVKTVDDILEGNTAKPADSAEVIDSISTKVKKIAKDRKPRTRKVAADAGVVQRGADVQVEQTATKIVDNGVKQDEAGVEVVNEVKKVAPEKVKMVEIAIRKRVAPDLSFMGDKRSPTLDIAAAEYNKRLLISGFLSNIIKPEDAQAIVDFAELKKNPAYKLIEKRGENTPNRGVAETIIRVRELIELSSNDEQRRMYDPLGIEITERTRESIEAIGVDLGFKPKTFMMMIRATIAIEGAKTDHLQNLFSKQLETIRKRQASGKELSTPQRNILSTVIKLSDEDAEARELNIPSVSPVQIIWVETIMAQYDVLLRTTLNDDALNDLYVAMLTKTTIYDNIVGKLGERYSDWSFVERDMRIVPARRNDVVYNVLKAALTNIQLDKQKATLGQRTVGGVKEIFQKEGSSQRKASDGTVIDILDTKKAPETEYELVMSVGGAKAAVRAGHIFASLFVYLKENGDEATVNFFTAKVKALESGNTTNYKSYIQKLYNLQQIKTEDGRSYTPEMIKTLEIKSEQLVTEWLEAVAAIEPDIARAVREIFPEIKKKSGKEPNITATFAQSVRTIASLNQTDIGRKARTDSEYMLSLELTRRINLEFSSLPEHERTLQALLRTIKTQVGTQSENTTALLDILSTASDRLLSKSMVRFERDVGSHVTLVRNEMLLDTNARLPLMLHEISHGVTVQFMTNELSRVLNKSPYDIWAVNSKEYLTNIENALSTKKLNPYVADLAETYLEYLEQTKMLSFMKEEGGEFLDFLSITELTSSYKRPELSSYDIVSNKMPGYAGGLLGNERNLSDISEAVYQAVLSGEDFLLFKHKTYLSDTLRTDLGSNSSNRHLEGIVSKYLGYQLKSFGLTLDDYLIKSSDSGINVFIRSNKLSDNKSLVSLSSFEDDNTLGFKLRSAEELKEKYGNVGNFKPSIFNGTYGKGLAIEFSSNGLPYGMGNMAEFVATAFDDEAHIHKLSTLTSSKASRGTLLNGIYNAVRGIFGLEENPEGFTLLHKLLTSVEGITVDSRNRIAIKTRDAYHEVQTVSFAQSLRKPKANQAILKANEFRQNLSTNKGRWYVLARKLQQAVSVEGVNNEEVAGIKVEMENLLASMSVQRKGLKALGLSEDYTPEDLAAADRLLKGLDALDPTSIKLGNEQASRIILNDILEIQDPEIKMEYIKAFRGLIDSKPELKPFLRALQKSSTDTTWLSKLADDLHIEDEEGAAADPTSLRKMSIEGRRAFLINEFFPKLTETLGNKAGPQNILSKFFQVVPGGEFIARQFQSLSGGAVAYNDTANSPYIGLAFLAKYFDPNIDVRDGEISGSYDMPSVERAEAESKLILTSSGIPEIRAKIVASNLSTEQLNALNTLAWKNLTRPDEVPQDTPHRLLIVELITARNKFNASVAEYLRKHGNNARLEDSHLYGTSHRPSDYAHNNPAEFVKALTKHELNKFMGSNELNGSTLHAMGWIEIIRAKDDGGVDMVVVRQSSPVARLFDEKEITKNDAKTPTKISWGKAKKKLIKADKEGMALLEETVLDRYHAALENVTDDYLPAWKEFYKNFSNPTAIFVSMRTAKDRILRLPEGESDNKSLLPLTYYANKASDYTEERLFTHDELIDNEELSKFYSSNILGLTIEETNTRLFQHIVTKDLTDLFGVKMSMDDLFQMIRLAETNYIRDLDTVDVKGRDSFFAGWDKLKKSWLHKTHRISGEISDYDKNFKFVLDNSHGFMMALGGVSAGIKTVASEIPRALLASDRNKSMLRQFIPNLYTMMKYTLGKTPGEKRLELLKMSSAIHWTRAVLEDTFTTTFETAASRNDYAGPVFGRQGWWRNLSERWSSLLAQNKAEKRFSDKVGNVGASVGWLAGGILRWSNEMVNVISMHNALKNFGDNVDNFRNLSDFLEKYRDRLDGATPNRKELNRLARLCGIAQEEALDLSRAGLLKKENINILHTALTQHKALTTTEGLPDSTKLLRWAETLEESAQAQARDAIFKFAGYIKTLARNTNTEPTLLDTRVTVDPVARMLRLYTQFGTSNSVQSIGRARRSGNVAMAKFLGGQLLMQMSGGLLLSYLLNGLDEEETSDEINNAPVAFFLSNIARMPVYGSYSWFYKALLAAAYGTYAHVNNQTVPKSVGKLDIPDLVSSPFQYRFDSVTKDIEKMPGLFARLFEGGTMSPYERKQAIDSLPFMENILLNGFLKNLQDPEEMEPLGLQRNISNEAIMPRRNNISSKAPRMLPSGSVGLSPLGVPPVGEQPTGMTPEPVRSFPKIAPPKKEVGGVSKELADALELL